MSFAALPYNENSIAMLGSIATEMWRNTEIGLNRARRLNFVCDGFGVSDQETDLAQIGLSGSIWRVMDLGNQLAIGRN